MNGNGKIARLPREIREQLNHRLADNEPGGTLLAWLNGLPEVQMMLVENFAGVPISKQNLSEWRTGGFRRWEAQRELLEQARDMAADADELSEVTDGRLTEQLATVLSARYAAVLSGWDGEVTDDLGRKLRMLHGLCRHIVALRRGDFHSTRLKLEQEREEREREKTEEEVVTHFQEWLKNPEVRKVVAEGQRSEVDRETNERREVRRVTDPRFGGEPLLPDGHQTEPDRKQSTLRRKGAKVRIGRAIKRTESKPQSGDRLSAPSEHPSKGREILRVTDPRSGGEAEPQKGDESNRVKAGQTEISGFMEGGGV